MTKQQSIDYARQCHIAKSKGQPKPPRPDNGTLEAAIKTLEAASSKQTSGIKTARHALTIAADNMDNIIDLLYLLTKETPELKAYCKQADFVQESIIETLTLIKTL